ncbi:MAG: sigma-70 family RNA polymerase sigma factor [Nitrospiraceae bacterium]
MISTFAADRGLPTDAQQAVPQSHPLVDSLCGSHDEALLARLRIGDEQAFDELVAAHHGLLFRLVLQHVADHAAAEEVVQDTWIAAIEGLPRFQGRSSLRTWLCGIAIHKAKDRGVRDKRQVPFSCFETASDDADDAIDPSRFHRHGEAAGSWELPPHSWDERTPETLLASHQAVTAMVQAIDSLPASLKDVLVLRDMDGLDVKEVCALLSITDANLYVRLHRARERVRMAVEQALR